MASRTTVAHLNAQITATRRLLWNASQMRQPRAVFALTKDLDRLVALRDREERALATEEKR